MIFVISFNNCSVIGLSEKERTSGYPILPGWYADPEGEVFGSEYWIYPTYANLRGLLELGVVMNCYFYSKFCVFNSAGNLTVDRYSVKI